MDFLDSDIKFLPGVGPKRAELLNRELNISTFRDLLFHFPYKYTDRTKFYNVKDINSDEVYIQLRGRITDAELIGVRQRQRLVAYFTDDTGTIDLVWFKGIKWLRQSLKMNREYILYGKPAVYGGKFNIPHPDLEEAEKAENIKYPFAFQASYPTTEKLKNGFITSRTIHKLQYALLQKAQGKIKETMPGWLTKDLGFPSLVESLIAIHFPENQEILKKARYRMKFEELFYIQLNLLKLKHYRKEKVRGLVFETVGTTFHAFYENNLPFELTGAQKRVMKEIRKDIGSGIQMNRLLQGDVGSGKTLVALLTILIAIDNGYQSAIMAPTEILAQQHYKTFTRLLEGLPVKVGLLTGSSRKSERNKIHDALESGDLNILIGTHALIEDTVIFTKLGLVVIDEQHRFGVVQRARLWEKNPDSPPHVLVMTATPIPRTLAMTLYGDLDVSVIDEMPPGRKEIRTFHLFDSKRLELFKFMKKQIAEGRQVYIVYPLIKESESMDYKDLEDGHGSITRAFPPPEYAVSVLHGRMKSEEKKKSMALFARGVTHIMISTTVIEVGVDVPNASVMVIESAERFGLSQLHQLRGRVGRGAEQSYCILMSGVKLSKDAKTRIETMVRTNDGFEIAEIDMKLRGPGDIEGTQQSGIPFDMKIANLARDQRILEHARHVADDILENDPGLEKDENLLLKQQLAKVSVQQKDWSVIS